MRKRLVTVLAGALATGAMLVACAGDGTIPVAPRRDLTPDDGPHAAAATTGGQSSLPVLQRGVALPADRRWVFTVGPAGGARTDVWSGLTVLVPAGAVSAPTQITVIALGGTRVAYRFEPHGLQFAKPVQLTQDLKNTAALKYLLASMHFAGAYFAGDRPLVDATGRAAVDELEPTTLDVQHRRVTMLIRHFSGYMFTGGGTANLTVAE